MININYKITRSFRKTVSIMVTKELEIEVKAPYLMTKTNIEKFINKHEKWIEKQIKRISQTPDEIILSEQEVIKLRQKAKIYLPQRVEYFENIMNVKATGVKINSAKTRWGSCTGKNGLNFSYRLMVLPNELIDYVVVHELAHITHKNHSKAFYDEIEKYIKDHKQRREQMKRYVIS